MAFNDDAVARSIQEVYSHRVDLENCDQEPLSHIRVVQGHACLLAVEVDTLIVRYVSENVAEFIGKDWREVIDQELATVVGQEVTGQIPTGLTREDGFEGINPVQAFFTVGGEMQLRNVILHRSKDLLIVEVEEASLLVQTANYQQMLSRAIRRIQGITNWDVLFPQVAAVIKQITGYDRVMIYQFDRENNGTVIAEAKNADLEAFEGLRYPHTDIPQQARDLYLINRVRLISGVSDVPSRIRNSETLPKDAPLDLTLATSRGVSPVHLEYLGYMGVDNSLSVAIVMDGKLWGLFALHHYSPRTIDYGTRNVLQFIGQIFSGHLAIQAASKYREQVLETSMIRLAIGENIVKTRDLFEGLSTGTHNFLNLLKNITGGVICFDGRTEGYGDNPPLDEVTEIVAKINNGELHKHKLYYESSNLTEAFPNFDTYCNTAAGILIIYLDPTYQEWICWFRPGIVTEINWGGKPEKEVVIGSAGTRRLGPRKSFERYVETVEGCSAEWTEQDIESALSLRITVIQSLMQRYTEVREINERLQKAYEDLETFSYTVSHDLRAPLRAINGYAEILEEDYSHKLDDEAHHLISGIQKGVDQMSNFITDILELSRVGSKGLQFSKVNLSSLVTDVMLEVRSMRLPQASATITVDPDLPQVSGDKRLLRQVYLNLLSNALKYAEPDQDGEVKIAVGFREDLRMGKRIYTVSNTGPAIPEEYKKTVFEMFMRLSSASKQEGSGVGLAIVERIVNRHDGKIWITDDLLGVTFNFFLDSEKSIL